MADGPNKRELALPPGTHAYVLDSTKGVVKLYVGPVVINQTGQDRPVKFNQETFKFDECTLEDALQQNFVIPEGFYAVLTNPAKTKDGQSLVYPEVGRPQDTPDLSIGLKENIPGPVNFALFPGQTCEIRRGHHLRSNEYLRIKIYNEDKARGNWSKAVIKPADSTPAPDPTIKTAKRPSIITHVPGDLAVGKQYNILGTEVAFYIPPTGVSVVVESEDENGRAVFVRQAETLEQLEYAILVDEDGNKKYPRGPQVVFPQPTQQFLIDAKGNRKFRAIEMNELQGIQLKFIDNVKLTFADGSEEEFKAGDEVFVKGDRMPIYYPEEGHQLVRYDGKTIHYAVAVPEGEARYVMDRKSGEIRTVEGPCMLLPDPVNEIIVRRALSDSESATWFPGADGLGSKDALAYNQWLRNEAAKEPTTRQGVVSEGRLGTDPQVNFASGAMFYSQSGGGMFANAAPSGFDALELAAMNYAPVAPSPERGVQKKSLTKGVMPESRQGKQQEAIVGDVAERKSTFNEPRTLTFAGKFKGVPTIRLQQGYAVQTADTDGKREVKIGPTTLLLNWGDTLDVLSLSTGKPKTTDKLLRTAYLNIYNNAVTDIIRLETVDLVQLDVKLSYRVNFEGDNTKWFSIENPIKHLCDRIRSRLKNQVHKITVEKFYQNAADLIRDSILGPSQAEGKARVGLVFEDNGMRVIDVEVLGVAIADTAIAGMLAQAQHQVVQQNIQLAQAKSKLEAVKQIEVLTQQEAQAKTETTKFKFGLEAESIAEQLKLELFKFSTMLERQGAEFKTKDEAERLTTFLHAQGLARTKSEALQAEELAKLEAARYQTQLAAQTQAIVDQMKAVDPSLVAALESATARETLIKVAGELSFHAMAGSPNAVDFIQKVFAGTPLQGIFDKTMSAAGQKVNGSAKPPELPRT